MVEVVVEGERHGREGRRQVRRGLWSYRRGWWCSRRVRQRLWQRRVTDRGNQEVLEGHGRRCRVGVLRWCVVVVEVVVVVMVVVSCGGLSVLGRVNAAWSQTYGATLKKH